MTGTGSALGRNPADKQVECLRGIVLQAYAESANHPRLGLIESGDQRWFPPGDEGQTNATIFAWRCFAIAASKIETPGPFILCAPVGRNEPGKPELLDELLNKKLDIFDHCKASVLVDFALFSPSGKVVEDPSKPGRIRFPRGEVHLTAESEMHVQHAAGWKGDYAWDFYKLLIVPSPRRLFFCRILAQDRESLSYRYGIETLKKTIEEMVMEYRGLGYLRDNDRIGVVMLSEEGWSAAGNA